jgi:hypothetical protein
MTIEAHKVILSAPIPSFPDERWDKEKETLFNHIKKDVKASLTEETQNLNWNICRHY